MALAAGHVRGRLLSRASSRTTKGRLPLARINYSLGWGRAKPLERVNIGKRLNRLFVSLRGDGEREVKRTSARCVAGKYHVIIKLLTKPTNYGKQLHCVHCTGEKQSRGEVQFRLLTSA
ncbi:hypothetical protein Bbelb_441460 [Branchiostoma belcheri]|nr:hypothetical protein Bbelb_441460 [Branchiostoma belcheri]